MDAMDTQVRDYVVEVDLAAPFGAVERWAMTSVQAEGRSCAVSAGRRGPMTVVGRMVGGSALFAHGECVEAVAREPADANGSTSRHGGGL